MAGDNGSQVREITVPRLNGRKKWYFTLIIASIIVLSIVGYTVKTLVASNGNTPENAANNLISSCPQQIKDLTSENSKILEYYSYTVECVDSMKFGEQIIRGLTDPEKKKIIISLETSNGYDHTFYHELGHVTSNAWDNETITKISERLNKPWALPTEYNNSASEIVAEKYGECRLKASKRAHTGSDDDRLWNIHQTCEKEMLNIKPERK